MKRKSPPDLERLRVLYKYDPESGFFIHLRSTGRGRLGARAGLLRDDGYRSVSIDGKAYLEHHLAWYYIHEEWELLLDHINRNRASNQIKNLRPATRAQNNGNSEGWAQQKRRHKLPRGVYRYARPGWYRAQIVADYNIIHLGCFDSIEAAESAYQKAAYEYFGEFAPKKTRPKVTDGVT